MSNLQLLIFNVIHIVGFSLNFIINMYGVKSIDCGGGMNVWLYSGLVGLFSNYINNKQEIKKK